MSSKGMIHQLSCPHTPQHNCIAERKGKKKDNLLDTACSLLLQANTPLKFWEDAILTAGYLVNCMPCSLLHNQILHSMLFSVESTYNLSTCFWLYLLCSCLSPGKDKLTACAIKCIFFGYPRIHILSKYMYFFAYI